MHKIINKMCEYCHSYASPVGVLTLTCTAQGLTGLHFPQPTSMPRGTPEAARDVVPEGTAAVRTRSALVAQRAVQRALTLPPAPASLPVLRQALHWLDAYFALPARVVPATRADTVLPAIRAPQQENYAVAPDAAGAGFLLRSPHAAGCPAPWSPHLPPLPPLLPLCAPSALPATARGTSWQRRVWALLTQIPYGQTTTYGALARMLAAGTAADDMTGNPTGTVTADVAPEAWLTCPSAAPCACPPRRVCARAVGGAVGRNPLGIFVPCHRVVGAHGTLTGFAGGLAVKRWLLRHEGAVYKTS